VNVPVNSVNYMKTPCE